MKKKLFALLLTVIIVVGVGLAGFAYSGFVSGTIYEESTAHLVEIFHQANQALYNMVSVNWSRMRMWTPFIEKANSEQEIVEYVNQTRDESNFTDFFFISRNGNYITLEGQKGYLDLRNKLEDLILEQKPIVVNSVVPDKPEIMVFATPAAPNSFRGFEYEAIAITYNNSDLVEALKISAFGGKAGTFAILSDGRVVVDNGSEELQNIHNFFALLEKSKNVSAEKIDELQKDFYAGKSGQMVFDINGTNYYLVYEPANFQDWVVLGVVPTDVVNASMNKLQTMTLAVVSAIVILLALSVLIIVVHQNRQKLRLKDNELIARDELFSKLSANVDDVFLMLDAENLRVDYVSPNIGKLLGISEEQVKKDVYVLEQLIKDSQSAHILDRLSEIEPGFQMEWDREYIHRANNEERWFHVIAFCSDIHGFLTNRNITFNSKLGETDTPYVLADAVRIREVLVNILGNAVKFTDDGGTISFETSYRKGEDSKHIVVNYRIADTGVGITEEFVEHIFDEFSQEDNGARTQYKGSGLGMAISKRYVDLMGGSISVESKKNVGSVFTVEFPLELTDKSEVQTKNLPTENVDLNGVKILLAEDNELNAEIATVQLEELGIKVTRACDGEETVKIFSENPPDTFDMIFMDIMMPKKNGYQATISIRSLPDRPDSRTIPIIAMTANAFVEDVQESLDSGMNGHLAKPIVMEEVTKSIVMNLNR